MRKFTKTGIFAAASIACSALSLPALAETINHRTVLDIRFAGLPVGVASFNITVDGDQYMVEAKGKTKGIVDLFAPGRGEAKSSGQSRPEAILASTNHVSYVGKDEKSTLDMTFENGNVDKVALETSKPRKKTGKKWIPVEPDHLKEVIDPASSLVISVAPEEAANGRSVCDRTIKIYDGDARYDMVLSYKKSQIVKTDGYGGMAFVCKLKYVPISGYKRGQKNIEYMTKNEGMELWLAPIAKKPVFTVIRVEVPTWLGQVTALPEKFVSSTQ